MECKIYDPPIAVINNNCCRVCGLIKDKKEFRRIWSLRFEKIKEMRVWCKACQTLWKKARAFPIANAEFTMTLD